MRYVPSTRAELIELVRDLSICLGDIDTSKITDMSSLFWQSFRTDYTGIETWDVSNVTNMENMFRHIFFLEAADLKDWDVSNVRNMRAMFTGTRNLITDLSGWDVSNVEDMSSMFYGSDFNQDISKWNISNVKKMSYMFADSFFNKPLNDWNVSNVTDMVAIFSGSKFNQTLDKWEINPKCCIDKFIFARVRPIQTEMLPQRVRDFISKHMDEVLVDYDETFDGTIVDCTDDEIANGIKKKKRKRKSPVIKTKTLRDGTIEITRYREH